MTTRIFLVKANGVRNAKVSKTLRFSCPSIGGSQGKVDVDHVDLYEVENKSKAKKVWIYISKRSFSFQSGVLNPPKVRTNDIVFQLSKTGETLSFEQAGVVDSITSPAVTKEKTKRK